MTLSRETTGADRVEEKRLQVRTDWIYRIESTRVLKFGKGVGKVNVTSANNYPARLLRRAPNLRFACVTENCHTVQFA